MYRNSDQGHHQERSGELHPDYLKRIDLMKEGFNQPILAGQETGAQDHQPDTDNNSVPDHRMRSNVLSPVRDPLTGRLKTTKPVCRQHEVEGTNVISHELPQFSSCCNEPIPFIDIFYDEQQRA